MPALRRASLRRAKGRVQGAPPAWHGLRAGTAVPRRKRRIQQLGIASESLLADHITAENKTTFLKSVPIA